MGLLVICLIVLCISTFEVASKCKAMILSREYSINEVSTVEVVNTRKSMIAPRKYSISKARA